MKKIKKIFRFEIYHRYGEWKCRFPWDLFHRHQVDMIKIWEWAVRRYRVVGLIPSWCCGWLGAPDTPSFWPMARRTGQLYCWDLTSGQSTTTPRYCPGPSWCYRTTELQILFSPDLQSPPLLPGRPQSELLHQFPVHLCQRSLYRHEPPLWREDSLPGGLTIFK